MILKKFLGKPTLKKGDPAPHFELLDQNNETHRLSDFQGQWLILFFYPKDASYGCTKEVCSFQSEFQAFEKLNCRIVGISVDSIESHKEFSKKHNLSYPLLADSEKKASKDYGVLLPIGVSNRVTFIINPELKIHEIVEWANWFNYGSEIKKKLEESTRES